MIPQFVPAPIAWNVEFQLKDMLVVYPVLGWTFDGQTVYTQVVDDNGGVIELSALFHNIRAMSYALVRADV